MQNGLPVVTTCEGCGGACCRNQPCPPGFHHVHSGFLDGAWPEDVAITDAAPAEVIDSLRSWFADRERLDDWEEIDGTPCFWLTEDGRCRHYEHRPTICREFEMDSDSCRAMRHQKPN